ncbi:hypothetical protein GCM10009623_20530 [Nocardioides aestuarii]
MSTPQPDARWPLAAHNDDPERARSLDGNAVAYALEVALGAGATTAVGTCADCGHRAPLAEVHVYFGPGAVLRCRGCDGALATLSERSGYVCIDLSGISAIETRRR